MVRSYDGEGEVNGGEVMVVREVNGDVNGGEVNGGECGEWGGDHMMMSEVIICRCFTIDYV